MDKIYIKGVGIATYRPNEIAEVVKFGMIENRPALEVKFLDGDIELVPFTEYLFLDYVFVSSSGEPQGVSLNNPRFEQRTVFTEQRI